MPKLDEITIEGFKSLASVQNLKLGAINVVIGANGSGKSNLIEAFEFLHAIYDGRLQDYVVRAGGADRLLHFGSKETSKIVLESANGGGRYRIELSPTDADELVPMAEVVTIGADTDSRLIAVPLARIGKEAGISATKYSNLSQLGPQRPDGWNRYHFHDTSSSGPIKKTADINDNRNLRSDAANLPSFLYLLRARHHAAYQLIRRTVQMAAPFFDDFVLEPQQLNPEKIRLEWRHKNSDMYFDASSLSDGTLRFIALGTLFLQPTEFRPTVILVDEPELGLHPYAIGLLASMAKQAAMDTQVILSTQSSTLLDHFEPEHVLVANRTNGSTRFDRLNATDLDSWLEEYSLGQLWEKNEIGGRPGRG